MSFLCRSGELIIAALFVAIAHFDLMGEHKAHDGQRNKGHNEAHRRRTPIHAPHLAAGRWRSSTVTLEPARSLASKKHSCVSPGLLPVSDTFVYSANKEQVCRLR